jgi:hypothetical protein
MHENITFNLIKVYNYYVPIENLGQESGLGEYLLSEIQRKKRRREMSGKKERLSALIYQHRQD